MNHPRLTAYLVCLAASLLVSVRGAIAAAHPASRPNVLFIAIDDMNDWTTLFDATNPIRTPNLQRLAARGTFFSRGYCNSPACNPSRTSVLSGIRPSTSGVYGNNTDWKQAIDPALILPAFFRRNGYRTYVSGKLFHHHGRAFQAYETFDEFLAFPSRTPDMPMPAKNLNGMERWTRSDGSRDRPISPNFDWGVWPQNPEDHIDNRTIA